MPDGQPDPSPNPEPSKKPKKTKAYVPALRSGAHAIVLALSTLKEHCSSSGMTKQHLIELAQPHCDSSFTAPSDPTKFYTAWASMKTLQNKALVVEWGHPTKNYGLSEEGWEVAKTVKATMGGAGSSGLNTDGDMPTKSTDRRVDSAINLEDILDDGDASIERAIRASLEDQASKGSRTAIQPRKPQSKDSLLKTRPLSTPSQTADNTDFLELLSSPVAGPSRQSRPWAGSRTNIQDSSTRRDKEPIRSQAAVRPKLNTSQDDTLHFKPLRLAPGSFTVELVLDNREVHSKHNRDYIQEELRARKVQPIVRPLDLGDALWVAKCKDPRLLPSLGEEGDEVILDWIIERKRLDDLISSIKDGRFLEQKFRMHKSGIKNVIYVIEDYTMSTEATQNYHEHVMSAISSTQVVNGYFVKRTRKLDDTIRYLARMTTLLKTLYEVSSQTPHANSSAHSQLALLVETPLPHPLRLPLPIHLPPPPLLPPHPPQHHLRLLRLPRLQIRLPDRARRLPQDAHVHPRHHGRQGHGDPEALADATSVCRSPRGVRPRRRLGCRDGRGGENEVAQGAGLEGGGGLCGSAEDREGGGCEGGGDLGGAVRVNGGKRGGLFF